MICRPSYNVISGSCVLISSNHFHILNVTKRRHYHRHHRHHHLFPKKNLSFAALSKLPPALHNKQSLVVDHIHLWSKQKSISCLYVQMSLKLWKDLYISREINTGAVVGAVLVEVDLHLWHRPTVLQQDRTQHLRGGNCKRSSYDFLLLHHHHSMVVINLTITLPSPSPHNHVSNITSTI